MSLEDKYLLNVDRVFLSGTQALVRLPLMQRARDAAAGLNTAGFITGYRGSPLGGYDMQLHAERRRLEAANILFQPALNEDLAATAVWGTQQVNLLPGAKYDGVFAMWYAKGPGVDRSGDPIKHGNRVGSSRHGGVLLVFGDDHPGKSSTVSHQSEQALAANGVPILYPASVQEYLDFGLHAFALSRAAGVWVGFKCVNETVETTATVDADPHLLDIRPLAQDALPQEGIHARFAFEPMRDEVRLMRFKLPRAQAYVRQHGLDRLTQDAPRRILGVVAAGKSWLDVQGALAALGVGHGRAASMGIRIYKPAMIWPLDAVALAQFARGHEELLFVEEKAAFMEPQAARALYNLPHEVRPRIVGKFDEHGAPLLACDVQLDPMEIALVIGRRLEANGVADGPLRQRLALLEREVGEVRSRQSGVLVRTPYFCSGCPHNTSTKVPQDSIALAGIGCHTLAIGMNRHTMPPTHMGGEGGTWIGMSPFTETAHVFQNLGDGTYVHSGLLAVRAAVVAGVNITYKILVNDAVAMTGGQPVEGQFSVAEITRQLRAERVERIAVVSDDIGKYGADPPFAPRVTLHDRRALESVQRELRAVRGVSALIYEQTCAAEKRRRAKRSVPAPREKRVFINERVCEGCGDCSKESNCVSIEPQESIYGRKRKINQSSCNKDYSCANGFCPSFVLIEGPGLRKPPAPTFAEDAPIAVPQPALRSMSEPTAVLITGIGGTGIVTVGAVLGMAAHLEGLSASVYDMTGLAQKGGAVLSHLRIAAPDQPPVCARIGFLGADLILGCDLVVTASQEVIGAMIPNRTRVLLNTQLVPTAAFQQNPDVEFSGAQLLECISQVVGAAQVAGIDAGQAALTLLGDTIGANLIMVGYALQQGLLPLRVGAVERAIALNGVAVEFNLRALALGRLAAHDGQRFADLVRGAAPTAAPPAAPRTLKSRVEACAAELIDYQDERYAARYRTLVDRTQAAEQARTPGRTALAEAVAEGYFKLLAYKDEYEVARLYSRGAFRAALDATFAPGYRVAYLLSPPLLGRKDPLSGAPAKVRFGAWMGWVFAGLAKLKLLRATVLDPFGWTLERRRERRLILEYEERIEELIGNLDEQNHSAAVEIAALALQIRGYGHVKRASIAAAEERLATLMMKWRTARAERRAA